jgi:hypothetical protein
MQVPSQGGAGGANKFFRLTLGDETLANYYKTNFSLIQHHHYSLSELEDMLPWERDIYIAMLLQYIEEETRKQKEQESIRRAAR